MSAQDHLPLADFRFTHTLPDNSSPADKRAYVDFRLAAYQYRLHWRYGTLSEYYAEIFRNITAVEFKAIAPDSPHDIRDILRNRDVYIPKGRNFLMADGLFAVVQDDIPWTKSEEAGSTENHTKNRQAKTQKEVADNRGEKNSLICSNMGNLFVAYSNDVERYSVLAPDNFD